VRKEISGHLRFLEKEAEKIEKGKTLRESLRSLYGQFIAGEETIISKEKTTLGGYLNKNKKELAVVQESVDKLSRGREDNTKSKQKELHVIDDILATLTEKRNEIARQLGRLEGMLELARREDREGEKKHATYTHKEIEQFSSELERLLGRAEHTTSFQEVREVVHNVRILIKNLKKVDTQDTRQKSGLVLSDVENEIKKLESDLKILEHEEKEANKKKNEVLHKESTEREEVIMRERSYYEAREREAVLLREQTDLERKNGTLVAREETLALMYANAERLLVKTALLNNILRQMNRSKTHCVKKLIERIFY